MVDYDIDKDLSCARRLVHDRPKNGAPGAHNQSFDHVRREEEQQQHEKYVSACK